MTVKPFPDPRPLFPIDGPITGPLDMLPIVPDPTGRGARAWSIMRRLQITEGTHAGRLIGENAPPWQERLTRLLFGHVDALGRRVIREAFACVSKKNGKTSYAAALALTKLLLDEERREQVTCIAATRQQAHIAFDAMTAMIRVDEELGRRFHIVEHRHVIEYAATNSRATAIAAELASVIGFNPSLAIVDELHLLGATPKGGKLVGQCRTGNVTRKEPLIFSISTAPLDRIEGIFGATYAKAKRVIAGDEVDPTFFVWLCEVPQDLNPEDPENWFWSNPSLGYTVTLDRLKASFESARSDPTALRDFRSQNLNISPDESAGIDRWLSVAEWDAAADPTLTLEALIEESRFIYTGGDAGGLDDLSAFGVLGRTADDRYLFWTHQWISRQGYEKRKSVNPYDDFIAAGELTIFDGGAGDIAGFVEVVQLAEASGKLSTIGIDSYGATELGEAFIDVRAELLSVPQGWRLTPTLSWVERRLADGTLRHSGTSIMRWNIGNCVVTRSGNAVSLSKATVVGAGKIDGVAAMLNAVAGCLSRATVDGHGPYSDGRPLLTLGG